jgi:hypothetical protein
MRIAEERSNASTPNFIGINWGALAAQGGVMRKPGALIVVLALSILVPSLAYASDWDKAGKALTIVEGIRLLTAGKVDVIGNIAGINKDNGYTLASRRHNQTYDYPGRRHPGPERIWVPHYVWVTKYIPAHKEYSHELGRFVLVKGHHIRYQVESGGHWETVGRCGWR